MKTKLLIILNFIYVFTFSQTKPETVSSSDPCDTLRSYIEKITIGFDTVINDQFSRILSGEEQINIGSFASLDVEKSQGTFKFSHRSDSGTAMWTFGATAGLNKGILNLFSGEQLSKNAGINLNRNWLIGKQTYTIELSEWIKDCKKAELFIEEKNEFYKEAKANIYEQFEIVAAKEICCPDTCNVCINNKLNISKFDKDSQRRQMREKNLQELEQARQNEIQEYLRRLRLKNITLRWMTAGFSVNNNVFKYFNPQDTPIGKQITKINTNNYAFNIAINYYKWRETGVSYFANGGVLFQYNDNFKDLDQVSVEDIHNSQQDSTYVRRYTVSTSAYMGTYKKPHLLLSPYINYYRFLRNKRIAIHLNLGADIRSKDGLNPNFDTPIVNSTIGFLFNAVQDRDITKKTKLNIELYFRFDDLLNGLQTDEVLLQRSIIGLRFTTPINFINR